MKKIAFTFITVLIMHAGFSQTNSANQTTLDSISKVVIHYMQTKQADSIYALAGERFKSQLTEKILNQYQKTRFSHLIIFRM